MSRYRSRFVHALNVLAENGDTECQYELGIILLEGRRGEDKNSEKAEQLLLKAAESGYADAMYELGIMSKRAGNREDAVKWFKSAADQNHAASQFELGYFCATDAGELYTKEFDVTKQKRDEYTQNDKSRESEKWYRLAAENGHIEAKNNLASILSLRGEFDEAERLYKEAANKGCIGAHHNLAGIYLQFHEHFKEDKKAYAAYLGCVAAAGTGQDLHGKFNLAIDYTKGTTVPQSMNVAMELLRLAANRGLKEAATLANDINLDLSTHYDIILTYGDDIPSDTAENVGLFWFSHLT